MEHNVDISGLVMKTFYLYLSFFITITAERSLKNAMPIQEIASFRVIGIGEDDFNSVIRQLDYLIKLNESLCKKVEKCEKAINTLREREILREKCLEPGAWYSAVQIKI